MPKNRVNQKSRDARALKAQEARYWDFLFQGMAMTHMAMVNLMALNPERKKTLDATIMKWSRP